MTRRAKLTVGSIALLSVAGFALSHSKVLGATLTVSWSYNYVPLLACTAPQDKNCIDHFEIKDVTDLRDPNDRKPLWTVQNPAGAKDKIDNIGATFAYTGPFGLRTIAVTAVGRDENSKRTESNPYAARKDVQIRPRIAARAQIN